MDVGGRVKASIKREVSNPERWLGKKAKNQSLPGRAEENDLLGKHGSPLYEHHDPPLSGDQDLAFQLTLYKFYYLGLKRVNLIPIWGRYKLSPHSSL